MMLICIHVLYYHIILYYTSYNNTNSYTLLYLMSYTNSVPDNSDDQSGLCLYIWARALLC